MIVKLTSPPILDPAPASAGLIGNQFSPNAQTAAANTGIVMQSPPSSAPKMTPQQAFESYKANVPLDHSGMPINNDTTRMLQNLSMRYPNRAILPDVPEPRSNGYAAPGTAYYQNHPDEKLDNQMLGQGV